MGNGKSLPSIMNSLNKPVDKAAFSNSSVDSMIRKIESEYIKILTPFDGLIKRLDNEINEIKTRIQHCKEKHLVEEEIGFYNVLNSFINTQFKIMEKKLDVVDKKIKAIQSEKKLAADLLKKSGGPDENTSTQILNPNSGVAIHNAVSGNTSLGVQKAQLPPSTIPTYKAPETIPVEIPQQVQAPNNTEVGGQELPPSLVETIDDAKAEVINTIDTAYSELGSVSPSIAEIYRHRKENEEEIFKTPNELGADYNSAYNSLHMKDAQSESKFYLDLNTGRFWIRTFEYIGGNWMEIVGNQPGIGVIGNVRIDANAMMVTSQLEFKYKLEFDNESNMPNIYRQRWDSEKYEQYIIDRTQLDILKQKCKL